MENSKFHDRGRMFSGYFTVKADRPTKLFGVYWHHAWPCGTYVNSKGVTRGVTFFQFYDDDNNLMPDNHTGRNCEQLDINLSETDALLADPVVGCIIKGQEVSAAQKAKVDEDLLAILEDSEGLKIDRKLVGRKLLQCMPEFLGRTFKQAVKNKPSIWQPTIDPETKVEVPNIYAVNLGHEVIS
jgi:hypothetical protein